MYEVHGILQVILVLLWSSEYKIRAILFALDSALIRDYSIYVLLASLTLFSHDGCSITAALKNTSFRTGSQCASEPVSVSPVRLRVSDGLVTVVSLMFRSGLPSCRYRPII